MRLAVLLLAVFLNAVALAQLPEPGTRIDSTNIDQFSHLFHQAFASEIADGEFSVRVGETFSIPAHQNYINATARFSSEVKLGETTGELTGYEAGLPFPNAPEVGDPRAGEKVAWNLRYAYGGDAGIIPEMYWYYRDMRANKLERTLEFSAKRYNFKHRVVLEPIPQVEDNRHDLHSAIYLKAHEPPDVSGTALLLYYNDDDQKVEQGWMYVPLLRRVRRIATKQKTDSFLGSDIMIEDFLGYSGRIMDMQWRYVGTETKLLPIYKHTDAVHSDRKARKYDYYFVNFPGPTHCLPEVPWQPRLVHIVEGSPIWDSHPLSKREFYIDAETSTAPIVALYDRAGAIWKLGIGGISHPDFHLPENAGSGVPLLDSSAMVDVQARHCTAIQMVTLANSMRVRARDFHTSKLDEGGR